MSLSLAIKHRSRERAPEVVSCPPRTMELQERSKQLYILRTLGKPHVRDNNIVGHSILFVRELIGADWNGKTLKPEGVSSKARRTEESWKVLTAWCRSFELKYSAFFQHLLLLLKQIRIDGMQGVNSPFELSNKQEVEIDPLKKSKGRLTLRAEGHGK